MCCSASTGSKIIGILSLIVALTLVGTSAWVFKEWYEYKQDDIVRVGSAITKTFDQAFNTNTSKYTGTLVDIMVYCSATTLAVGGLQLLASITVLIGGGKSRAPGCCFGFISFAGIIAICAVIGCIYKQGFVTADNIDSREDNIKYWVGTMLLDVIYFCFGTCIIGCLSRND